uniref:Hypothetical transmembrane protein n=1 Tax=uncultured delta proteobacterium DeepAnt-32C6 TaxID=357895 RepID=Q2I6L0_9DELT|nr:hypothetical transmembrane protein [uncultured delta proteobacterium DeepAnt-32C6]
MVANRDCPACGAPVDVDHAQAATAFCAYCGQALVVLPEGFEARGGRAKLATMPTAVKVGDRARVGGATYQVLGQVQYAFEDGVYNHFYLSGSAGEAWLEQDEGEFRLFNRTEAVHGAPDFDDLGVGESVTIGGGRFYPMEFNEGSVVGGVGVIPLVLAPGETFNYVDGTYNGDAASLDYALTGVFLMVGKALSPQDIEVL